MRRVLRQTEFLPQKGFYLTGVDGGRSSNCSQCGGKEGLLAMTDAYQRVGRVVDRNCGRNVKRRGLIIDPKLAVLTIPASAASFITSSLLVLLLHECRLVNPS